MLSSVSWQQYLTAAALSGLAWYFYVGLRYYRAELSSLLRLTRSPQNHLSLISQPQHPVMGAVQPDQGTALHDPEELTFGTSEPDDIGDATIPSGPTDELLAEGEMLIEAFRETDDKQNFLSVLRVLIEKYTVYSDEIDLGSTLIPLKDLAASKLPFPLNDNDWPAAWPEVQ